MNTDYILSIDQGTTGSTALLLNSKGERVSFSNVPFKQIYPKDSWVEHDPKDIINSVKKAIKQALSKASVEPSKIKGIGVTNQRETVVFWNKKTGKTYGNALVWQCKRTQKRVEYLKAKGLEKSIQKKTGLKLDPYFSASKIEWFLKNFKGSKKDLAIGTIDSFLVWSLTGGTSFSTEASNASRTMLFNLKSLTWDEDLLKLFKVKKNYLPELKKSNGDFGKVKGFSPLKDGTPIRAVLGDQQSSLYGNGALNTGDVKCTFGTGSFILMNTGKNRKLSKKGLLTTVAWDLEKKGVFFALEGGAFNCASCINWFTQSLGVLKKAEDIGPYSEKVKDSLGVRFAPSFSGLGAPYWSSKSRGAFVGLNLGVLKEHMCKALLEGLSFQNELIFRVLEQEALQKISKIYVDGGASKSDAFMKIQSKFSNKTLIRPKNIETTALGVGLLAGKSLGLYDKSPRSGFFNEVDKRFKLKSSKADKETLKAYMRLFDSLEKSPFATE